MDIVRNADGTLVVPVNLHGVTGATARERRRVTPSAAPPTAPPKPPPSYDASPPSGEGGYDEALSAGTPTEPDREPSVSTVSGARRP